MGYAVGMEESSADSSRFGSSGTLSQSSSQFSSEQEDRSNTESQNRPSFITRTRLSSEEVEKGERETRTQEKGKENVVLAPSESSFKIDSSPIASSRLRWLKAISKVRVNLHQVGKRASECAAVFSKK
ncbi:hypothetical protein Baya_10592 [Bagarius yarrelli]|uniref:Uncharacterized protein n=1 Tax=Bagarius yarrelli TaxID=175774 RepID=A0A556UFY0_BAGYA|nr:hypothetical protein Baya_10592 [Bagarius yarrelli]